MKHTSFFREVIIPTAIVAVITVPLSHLFFNDIKEQALLGKMLGMAGQLAREQGSVDGFRVVINNGRVGRQEVYHLHVHVLGGPSSVGRMI